MTIMTEPEDDAVDSTVEERCYGGCTKNRPSEGNGTKESDHMDESNWEEDPGDDGDVESTGSLDEQESFQKRSDLAEELKILEAEFNHLKNVLFQERLKNIEDKQSEVMNRTAVEYSHPVQQINENVRIREQIIELKAQLTKRLAEFYLECENRVAENDYEEARRRAKEEMRNYISRYYHRLEERLNESRMSNLFEAAPSSGLPCGRFRKRRQFCDPYLMERRKRPLTITGPYIVYSLREEEVKEDLAKMIRLRARSGLLPAAAGLDHSLDPNGPYSARYDSGRLIYEDECYSRNDLIRLDERSLDGDQIHSMRCRIVAVHSNGILIKTDAGSRSKIGLSSLQVGRFKLVHLER